MRRLRTGTWAKVCALALCTSLLAGCAVSAQTFYGGHTKVSDLELCKTERSSEAKKNRNFHVDVVRELMRRSQTPATCAQMIRNQHEAIAAGLAAGALIYAASRDHSGGSAGSSTSVAVSDYSWDWDEFYNEYGTLVWACRGVQTGQFAETFRCYGKAKIDWHWPNK